MVIEIYPFTDGLFWLSYLPWIEKQNLEPILSHLSKLILLDKQGQSVHKQSRATHVDQKSWGY